MHCLNTHPRTRRAFFLSRARACFLLCSTTTTHHRVRSRTQSVRTVRFFSAFALCFTLSSSSPLFSLSVFFLTANRALLRTHTHMHSFLSPLSSFLSCSASRARGAHFPLSSTAHRRVDMRNDFPHPPTRLCFSFSLSSLVAWPRALCRSTAHDPPPPPTHTRT